MLASGRLALCGVLLVLASCVSLTAQNVVLTGSLGGRVTDLSGAVVPGASVVVRNLATGVQQSADTNYAGLYRFPVVMPGSYSISASLKGFRDVQALVRVLVGNTTSQDIQMQVGASADTVRVIETTPLLRPEDPSTSTVIDRSLIEDLPLNGRKYSNFMVLTPNTSYDGDTGLVSIAGQQGGEDSGYANGNGSTYFSVDGSNATNTTLDGMDFNNQFDFSNTHAPSLLDQRHRVTLAAVYRPRLEQLIASGTGRKLLSGWTLSSIMEFSSGRPYAGLLGAACTSSTLSFSNCNGANENLNDTAFNQDTAATAGGINGAGPTPGIGLNSFYGPWLERIDAALARSFEIREVRNCNSRRKLSIFSTTPITTCKTATASTKFNTSPSAPPAAMGSTPTSSVIWYPIPALAISEPSRKSAPTVFPGHCSFR